MAAKMRYLKTPKELEKFIKIHNLRLDLPFVLFFPDHISESVHDVDMLGWDRMESKSFAALMKQANVQVIIMSEDPNMWSYSKAISLPYKNDFALYLISKAAFVLSKDPDFLIISNMLSNSILVADKVPGAFDLEGTNKVLGGKNITYVKNKLLPIDAYNFIGGKGID